MKKLVTAHANVTLKSRRTTWKTTTSHRNWFLFDFIREKKKKTPIFIIFHQFIHCLELLLCGCLWCESSALFLALRLSPSNSLSIAPYIFHIVLWVIPHPMILPTWIINQSLFTKSKRKQRPFLSLPVAIDTGREEAILSHHPQPLRAFCNLKIKNSYAKWIKNLKNGARFMNGVELALYISTRYINR